MKRHSAMNFDEMSCPECGIRFCLTAEHHQRLQDNEREFCCPRGHILTYGISTVETNGVHICYQKKLMDSWNTTRKYGDKMFACRHIIQQLIDELNHTPDNSQLLRLASQARKSLEFPDQFNIDLPV